MSNSEYLVREATREDVPTLLAFEQSLIEAERACNASMKPDNIKYYDFDSLISNNDVCLIVVEKDAVIIGAGFGQIRPSNPALSHDVDCYLDFMYVDPSYRGQGINQWVIDYLLAWSRARSVTDFYLRVYAGNTPAIRAYEKLGFTPNVVEMKLNLGRVD
ncbi:GNAT family N-acetyltransferase [Enterovibrio sp. ZSDZ35]|uniref:GNAT family N-acetyltransferase n=1 Tax=Enterovibrio qingdaonensis TaxID=2899818 RepID=A0ABT5QRG0_9GAMM|nr:GNAT family N-acetyltransferase [Enterovibrio sp. ZSDZ35]MDD1782881.1 GNAT family N-acetyltransferase [Enterovibrio sp. ZSDZ35]